MKYKLIKTKKLLFINNNEQMVLDVLGRKGLILVRKLSRRRALLTSWLVAHHYTNLQLYFATFTFNNEHLPFNRNNFYMYLYRKKINAILIDDYGKENGRFHLHGFIGVNPSDQSSVAELSQYGFTKITPIGSGSYIDYIVKYSACFNTQQVITKPIVCYGAIKKDDVRKMMRHGVLGC